MIIRPMILSFLLGAIGAVPAAALDILLSPTTAELNEELELRDQRYIANWKSTDAAPSWAVDVPIAGEYHYFVELSCPGWSTGAEVQLWVDGRAVSDPFAVQKTPGNSGESFASYRITQRPVRFEKGLHQLELKAVAAPKVLYYANVRLGLLSPREKVGSMIAPKLPASITEFSILLTTLRNNHPEWEDPALYRCYHWALWDRFPQEMNWLTQDANDADAARKNSKFNIIPGVAVYFRSERTSAFEVQLIHRVLEELDDETAASLLAELNALGASAGEPVWLELYVRAANVRRAQRLKPLLAKTEQIIYAKHQVFASKTGIYNMTETEGLLDGESSSICAIDLSMEKQNQFATSSVLFDPQGGMVRDPELNFAADKMLFAWRKNSTHINTNGRSAPDDGNYQIIEMDLATRAIRPLTDDETYGANYEACYLPDGNILFNSARIVQQITCGFGDHSNLFVMDKDGQYQRRLGFDQVSTQFPAVLNNGQVIYLRRDYNDRGQAAAHALFVMNPDGTGQTEFYGNQTGTPNSFMHARAIPGSDKVVCVLGGYHTRQGGQLALMDIREGRNHGEGIVQIPQLTKPANGERHDDGYAKQGVQTANPCALSETEFIVSRSDRWAGTATGAAEGEHYGIFFMTSDNRRELLAWDPTTSCLQPVAVMKRARPTLRPSLTDYTKDRGTYYVQNVYIGQGSEGITNSVKKIRVVEILYKEFGMYAGLAQGPGSGYHTLTAPGHPLSVFDAKKIIGEATVYEDGSALFEVPARTPVYFQLLDEKNRCLQTMRSWTTLMPNERFSCVGCHEDKNETPVTNARTMALSKGIEKLKPFYGEPRGFSYLKEVQPVFDAHCIQCHALGKKGEKLVLTAEPFVDAPKQGRRWAQSYVKLMAARPGPHPEAYATWDGPDEWTRRGPAQADEPNRYVQYWTRLNTMWPKAPYYAGAITSGMIQRLEKGHHGVKLPQQDWDKLVAWIDLNCPYVGDYMEANIWTEPEVNQYNARMKERKRNELMEAENIRVYIEAGQP